MHLRPVRSKACKLDAPTDECVVLLLILMLVLRLMLKLLRMFLMLTSVMRAMVIETIPMPKPMSAGGR